MAESVCLVFSLMLTLMPAWQAREVVAAYADRAAPGSYVVVSCGRYDDAALWKQLAVAYTPTDLHNHSPGEVEGFLAAKPVPPRLTAAQSWRGGWHDMPAAPPGPAYVLAALPGRQPGELSGRAPPPEAGGPTCRGDGYLLRWQFPDEGEEPSCSAGSGRDAAADV